MRPITSVICLIACLFSAMTLGAPNDDDTPDSGGLSTKPADSGRLTLDSKTQTLAGIKTERLQNAKQQPEFTAYGTVLSLEPLLNLRQQYLTARAQQDSAQAKYTEAHHNLSRTQDLHAQDIVSTRRLQEQQAQWHAEKANLDAAGVRQQTILAASRLEWGDTLTDWFILMKGKAAGQFLDHGAALLQVTLPASIHLDPAILSIYVDERGRRIDATQATLISASPRIDPLSQGERYFFRVEGLRVPFGTQVTAWIPHGEPRTAGVLVPSSAVVWHMGQAFVFVKTGEDVYSRRALSEHVPGNQGYIVGDSLTVGEEIVTSGAQTLLSEFLKSQIPSEDDD